MPSHATETWPTRLIGIAAIAFPALHTFTDGMEWSQHGFSPVQLWLNYAAFLPMPAIVIGLYAVQRPRIGLAGLLGALSYGFAFVYFAHSTLYAIAERIADYETLWARLGAVYTVHGAVMVAGGVLFGVASLRARVLASWAVVLFLAGITVNAVLALLPAPDILQTMGTLLRNGGLMGMGWSLLRPGTSPRRSP